MMPTRRDVHDAYRDLKAWIEGQRDHCFPDEIDAQLANLETIASATIGNPGLDPER
jgi:hypothetical protein